MFAGVADKSFILIQAEWPAQQARELLGILDASDVIVRTAGRDESYYLMSRSEAKWALEASDEETLVRDALSLEQLQPTPVVHAYDNELGPDVPDPVIVVEGDDVIGFYRQYIRDKDLVFLETDYTVRMETESTVTRSVVTRFPSKVVVGGIALLAVSLTGEGVAGSLTADFEVGAQLDVRVEALRRFQVVGPRQLGIVVLEEAVEPKLQFQLLATEEGLGAICAYISVGAQTLGSITLEAEVVASAEEMDTQGGSEGTVGFPLPAVPVLVPDLSLTIAEDWIEGETFLTFELKTREDYGGPQVVQPFEPVPLEQEPQAYFREFFKELAGQPLSEAEWYLGWKGSELFQSLVPEGLRNVLWSLRDRIYSVQLLSRDPWIPWELCRLQGWEDEELKEGPFLCQAFAVTRWLPELQAKPALKLREVALVVPEDSKLKHAAPERDHLLSLQKDGDRNVTLIPATRQQVFKAMQSGKYDAWHFVGHGELDPSKPNRSLLRLEKGQTLEPSMLTMGPVMNLGKAQPLVFLNACQTGESISGLTGPAGWAERFLKAAWDRDHQENGAAVFLGAYWPVISASAFEFAQAFYNALLGENGGETKTVGQAVRKARKVIQKPNDPTWLAYTVFAHPLAKVEA